jgi:hypothetical protein
MDVPTHAELIYISKISGLWTYCVLIFGEFCTIR